MNPFDKPRHLALYQTTDRVNLVFVAEYYGSKDSTSHGPDVVRISEPLEVHFVPLSTEDAINSARASLDTEERRLQEELNSRLQRIREMREKLGAGDAVTA